MVIHTWPFFFSFCFSENLKKRLLVKYTEKPASLLHCRAQPSPPSLLISHTATKLERGRDCSAVGGEKVGNEKSGEGGARRNSRSTAHNLLFFSPKIRPWNEPPTGVKQFQPRIHRLFFSGDTSTRCFKKIKAAAFFRVPSALQLKF